jgi:putative effector of murein hydrolase LrgA (UPF0299 family)
MTESTKPPRSPDHPGAVPAPYPGQPVESLSRYLEVNRDRFTDEALARAARDAGYSDAAIDQARVGVQARSAAAPVRARARWAVLAAYFITYAVLVAGMFASEYARQYGGHVIGAGILGIVLLFALLLSLRWVRSGAWKGGDAATGMAVLLSVPVVLLVVVAGLCVGTGYPIPRAS